jgi:hypothetical protein
MMAWALVAALWYVVVASTWARQGVKVDRNRRRWQWDYSGKRFEVVFPHGPRDYPWWVELRDWLEPSLWFSRGSESWPCFQIHIWRLYIRYWYGGYRWSAKKQELVWIQGGDSQ